jgi:hypothetical protein
VAGCCECGDEPSDSCATVLVLRYKSVFLRFQVEVVWLCQSSCCVMVLFWLAFSRLDDQAAWVRSPAEVKDFPSSLCVQTCFEAHPASCPMDTGCSFPGSTGRPGRDADLSPPSSAEVKNE